MNHITVNGVDDVLCRTIKSNYSKTSIHNILSGNAFTVCAVIDTDEDIDKKNLSIKEVNMIKNIELDEGDYV